MRTSVCSIARRPAVVARPLSPFVCTQCQRAQRSWVGARHASSDAPKDKLPYTERFRRRLWGTDNPPGQKDPYNRASPEELDALYEQEAQLQEDERAASQAKAAARRGVVAEAEPDADAEAEEADRGARAALEQLGHKMPVGEARATTAASELVGVQIRAPVGDELDASGYEPAETWDGLARIGGRETLAQRKAWNADHPFYPFIPSKEVAEHLREGFVHRALVEVLTLKEAGLPLTNASFSPRNAACGYGEAEVVPQGSGYALSYSDDAYRQEVLQSMVYNEDAALDVEQHVDDAAAEPSATKIDTSGDAPAWHGVRIDGDIALKFALLRRTMQLTGRRIRDPAIAAFETAGDVVAHLKARPKPTKLYDVLVADPELSALPNMQIRPNKYTSIGKDMEFGRHKVVVAELAKRGLRPNGKELKVEVNYVDAEEELELENVHGGKDRVAA